MERQTRRRRPWHLRSGNGAHEAREHQAMRGSEGGTRRVSTLEPSNPLERGGGRRCPLPTIVRRLRKYCCPSKVVAPKCNEQPETPPGKSPAWHPRYVLVLGKLQSIESNMVMKRRNGYERCRREHGWEGTYDVGPHSVTKNSRIHEFTELHTLPSRPVGFSPPETDCSIAVASTVCGRVRR